MARFIATIPRPITCSVYSLQSVRQQAYTLRELTVSGSACLRQRLDQARRISFLLVAKASSKITTDSNNIDSDYTSDNNPSSISTTVTLPRKAAIDYLTRTLASVKRFKQELAHEPAHTAANAYPPFAVIYGKSTPTVFGAKVDGREGIKHADAYDELAFASGDGVVLAKAAMLPEGYHAARGGTVSSERGHVTLLGDLEAVGRCLNALVKERRSGVGVGPAV